MRRLLFLLALLLAGPAFAQATYPTVAGSRVNGVVPLQCDVNGANCAPATAAAPLLVTGGTGTSSSQVQGNVASGATDSGNPVKVGAYASSTPPGAVGTGQRANLWASQEGALVVATSYQLLADATSNNGGFFRTAANADGLLASGQFVFNGTLWDRLRTIQGAAASGLGTLAVIQAPSSATAAGIVPVVSTALESCHVLKASAGNLYTLGVTIQATTVIVQVFNATSAPGDGAVTPIWSQPVISNGTLGGATWSFAGAPIQGATGLTVCASSATTPFTKTASATAMFSAGVE